MAELPAHPDPGTLSTSAAPPLTNAEIAATTAGKPRWKAAAWAVAVVAVLALFIVLHLTGVVGAESHK
jgi:hypothetical protein